MGISARYFRYVLDDAYWNTGWYIGMFAEFNAIDSNGIDVAAGKTTAFSSQGGNATNPAFGVDGNYSSIVTFINATNTPPSGDSHWWSVDLGQAYDINVIRIRGFSSSGGGYAHTKTFRIQYSNDGINWTQCGQMTNRPNVNTRIDEIYLNKGYSYRYLKLVVDDAYWNSGWFSLPTIREFEAYGPNNITNLASGKTASIPSVYAGAASNAVDGTTATTVALYNGLGPGTSYVPDSCWLKVDLGSQQEVRMIKVVNHTSSGGYSNLKSYRILGSNNDSQWTEIYQVTGKPDIAGRTDELVTNNTFIRKFLIKDGQYVKKYSGGIWTDLGTGYNDATFIDHGMDSVASINKTTLNLLSSNDITVLIYEVDGEPNRDIKLTYKPLPQLILSNGDIAIGTIDALKSVNLSIDEINGGIVRLITSVDSGATWKTYYDGQWIDIDTSNLSEVETKGMSQATLALLTSTEYSALINDSSTIRFGYYLKYASSISAARTDQISITVDMKGEWEKGVLGTDCKYSYPDSKTLKVTLFDDGNWKVNY